MSGRPNSILELARKKPSTANTSPNTSLPAPASVRVVSNNVSERIVNHPWKKMAPAGSVRYVAGHLLDENALMANAPPPSAAASSRIDDRSAASSCKGVEEADALQAEISQLLGKRSRHAAEADDDWHERYAQQLQRLERQEKAAQRSAQDTHCIRVKGFECSTCKSTGNSSNGSSISINIGSAGNSGNNSSGSTSGGSGGGGGGTSVFLFDRVPEVCLARGHAVRDVLLSKRFYACRACRRGRADVLSLLTRDQATRLHLPPAHPCGSCGTAACAAWAPCGMRGQLLAAHTASAAAAQGAESLAPAPLLHAAAAHTTPRDQLAMRVRISQLQ